MDEMNIIERLHGFLENEARSCSMVLGCVTPLYVYRMWNGAVGIVEICGILPKRIRSVCKMP